jgi:integrase
VARIKLTDRFVQGARPRGAEVRSDYYDDVVRGLMLRVTTNNVKTWSFMFTASDGKRARVRLGNFPIVSLAAARGLALEAARHRQEGQDPRAARRSTGAMTVAMLIEQYIEGPARSLRSGANIERRLRKNVMPVIGDVKLSELHRRDVSRVTKPILDRGARVEAARVFEDLRSALNWAVGQGLLDHNPMDGANKPNGNPPRERVLSDAEIATLWNGLPTALPRSKAIQRIIKLCLLTAQRVGEISGMRADELDLRRGLWSLPGSRTKNGFQHQVPLSGPAIAVIKEALKDAGRVAEYVFSSNGGSLPPHAVAVTIRRGQKRFGIPQWTAHDLRRTALTGMNRIGIAPLTLGHIANHRTTTKAGVTLGIYVIDEHTEQKTKALDLWASRLDAIVTGGAEVIPLAGRR